MLAWESFIESQEKIFGKATTDHWLRSIKVATFDSCNLYLIAKDTFHITWFEEHIRPKLKDFKNNNHRPIKVHIKVEKDSEENKIDKTEKFTLQDNDLNPSFTFGQFVVADENKIPYTLLKEEAFRDVPSFNPIFIYGAAGSGKTHLLSAFTHKLKEQGKKVFFVSAKTFTKHVVDAIRLGYMQDFRKTYRNVDALIVDDIDFLANKSATQEEFFHTFNTLHTEGKILLLSARSAPLYLKDIEPRLISRFEWGIELNLENLKKENVEELLEKASAHANLLLDQETKRFLFTQFSNDLNGLKKAIDAITLRSHISNESNLNLPIVKRLINDLIQIAENKKLSEIELIEIVSSYFQLSKDDLLGKAQGKAFSFPRQIAMFLLKDYLNLSYSQIGKIFLRDHSTVISSIKKINKELQEKKDIVIKSVLEIKDLLKSTTTK